MADFRPNFQPFMSVAKRLPTIPKRLIKNLVPLLTIFFLGIFFLNLFLPKTLFEKAKEAALLNSRDLEAHQVLSQLFFAANDFDNAEKELTLVNSLGTAQEFNLIKNTQNQPDKVKEEILFWSNLVAEVPSYRDAYIKLSLLSASIYRDLDAQKFLDNARQIDPNNPLLTKITESLGK